MFAVHSLSDRGEARPMAERRGAPPFEPSRRNPAHRLYRLRVAPVFPRHRFRALRHIRQLRHERMPEILRPGQADSVHVCRRTVPALNPGGIATNIARDTPLLLKPVIHPVLTLLFQTPGKAVGPTTYLCCAQASGEATGMYLRLIRRKSVSPAASDPENGTRLWEASEALVAKSRESL